MTTKESIVFLKSLGYGVYPDIDGWKLFRKGKFRGKYTDRELIKKAQSSRTTGWKPTATSKSKVGPGGKWCSCCTKVPPSVMKRWERRSSRHKKIELEVDFV